MNALELAYELENNTAMNSYTRQNDRLLAATMLRQQQERINELEHRLRGADAIIKLWTPIVARHSMKEHL